MVVPHAGNTPLPLYTGVLKFIGIEGRAYMTDK